MVKIRNRIIPLISLVLMPIFLQVIQLSPFYLRSDLELNWFLFWAGMAVIAVALATGAVWTSALTAAFYVLGFFAGVLFNQNRVDPGGVVTNNYWMIWFFVYLAGFLVGVCLDVTLAILRGIEKIKKMPQVDVSSP